MPRPAKSDQQLVGFTEQAVSDLESAIARYRLDLLQEISRIEASQNTGNGRPEVTSAMVHDAELVYSRGPRYRRRKSGMNVLKIVAIVAIFVAGTMADSDFLKTYTNVIIFLIVACIAIISSTIVTLKE